MNIRPVDLVFLRNEFTSWCHHRTDNWSYKKESNGYAKPVPANTAIIETLKLAELFHVSSDMTQLSIAAAETVPLVFERGDLPSEFGLLLFESGALTFTEKGITWGDREGRGGTFITRGFAWGQMPNGLVVTLLRDGVDDEEGNESRLAPYCLLTIPYGIDGINTEGAYPSNNELGYDPGQHVRLLISVALLMRQSNIAASGRYTFSKLDKAKFKRRRTQQSPVRVITLRNPSGGNHSGNHREYMHRWIVRGHWRRQACGPERSERKLTWITPYIKGPEDAPLLAGEKVYSWVR